MPNSLFTQEEFVTTFYREQRRYLRLAQRILGNESDAQDALQEAALNVWRSASRFRGECELASWFVRILKNVCFNQLTRRKRTPTFNAKDIDTDDLCIPVSLDCPTLALEQKQTAQCLVEAIESLPESHREAFRLCDIHHVSYSDIAQRLRIPIGTVRSRISRARNALHSKL